MGLNPRYLKLSSPLTCTHGRVLNSSCCLATLAAVSAALAAFLVEHQRSTLTTSNPNAASTAAFSQSGVLGLRLFSASGGLAMELITKGGGPFSFRRVSGAGVSCGCTVLLLPSSLGARNFDHNQEKNA